MTKSRGINSHARRTCEDAQRPRPTANVGTNSRKTTPTAILAAVTVGHVPNSGLPDAGILDRRNVSGPGVADSPRVGQANCWAILGRVKRSLAVAAAMLTLAGCSTSTKAPVSAPSSTAPVAVMPSSAAPTSVACSLSPSPDLLVRHQTPGLQDDAQIIGSADLVNCTPTLDSLPSSSPTGPGYCTWVALLSDNPGYNVDARPAAPLKKVIEAFGAGCP